MIQTLEKEICNKNGRRGRSRPSETLTSVSNWRDLRLYYIHKYCYQVYREKESAQWGGQCYVMRKQREEQNNEPIKLRKKERGVLQMFGRDQNIATMNSKL